MVHPRRTSQKSTECQPTGQLVPRDVPPPPESQLDSPQYIPQGEDSFEIVVTVPDEDINTSAIIIPSIKIPGPITRSRARSYAFPPIILRADYYLMN
jgi:hypothetical protein